MSASDGLSISLCGVPPTCLIPYSPRFVTEGQGPLQILDPAEAKEQARTQCLSCRLSTCWSLLASRPDHVPAHQVLPGNLPKIHSQDLPSFLYASKRYSSRPNHRPCLLVLERPCSASLEHLSSSLLDSESLSLKLSLSLLLNNLLLRVASTLSRPASTVVDRVVPPNEGRDEVYRLKPVKRNKCYSTSLMVKTLIFPTWPMLSIS